MAVKPESPTPTPEAQLRAAIDALDPKTRTLVRAVRAAVRKRFPTANELVYEYSFALVISYAPAEQGIDGVVAIRASDTGVSLYFSQGPTLPDPTGLLRGSAKTTRYIELASARQLAHPAVEALIAAAVAQVRVPLPAAGKGRVVIKSAGAKKPAGRKAGK